MKSRRRIGRPPDRQYWDRTGSSQGLDRAGVAANLSSHVGQKQTEPLKADIRWRDGLITCPGMPPRRASAATATRCQRDESTLMGPKHPHSIITKDTQSLGEHAQIRLNIDEK